MRIFILIPTVSLFLLSCNNTSKVADISESNTSTQAVVLPLVNNDSLNVKSDTIDVDTVMQLVVKEPEQFVQKHILTEEDLYRDYDGGNYLSNFFEIELIDRDSYLRNRTSDSNFITFDSASLPKKDGTLQLPLDTKGYLTLTDKIVDNDNYREYRYIGKFSPLNMYLVQGLFWEDWSYILYDKKNGRQVQSFIGIPYLSADFKYIACVEIDSFEGVGSMSLYAITENVVTKKKYIDPIVEMYVKSWVPYTALDNIYWGDDGYLYVPVIYAPNFWDAEGNYYGLDQYIRIRPRASA